MSHWNYRLVKHEYPEETDYGIHEVYYDDEGNITMWSSFAIAPSAETPEDMLLELSRMFDVVLDDIDKGTILNADELPGAK